MEVVLLVVLKKLNKKEMPKDGVKKYSSPHFLLKFNNKNC